MAEVKHYETDVAIVGSGGAGIAAGIEARDAGARAISFETSSEIGGAAIISGGGCMMVGTPLQKENGIDDTPDLAFDDWVKWGGPSVDQVWARYYIEHTLHDLYHWAEDLGAKWIDMKPQEGNSVRRWTRPERSGLGLMTHLIDGFRERGGEIVPNVEITRIKRDNDRVVGVEGIDTETGGPVDVAARTVVVSTGGFNSNLDMVLEVRPDLANERIMVGSGRGSTGSGHKLVREVGGYLTHMDHVWFYAYATPDYRDPDRKRPGPMATREFSGRIRPMDRNPTSGIRKMIAAFSTNAHPRTVSTVGSPPQTLWNATISDPVKRLRKPLANAPGRPS